MFGTYDAADNQFKLSRVDKDDGYSCSYDSLVVTTNYITKTMDLYDYKSGKKVQTMAGKSFGAASRDYLVGVDPNPQVDRRAAVYGLVPDVEGFESLPLSVPAASQPLGVGAQPSCAYQESKLPAQQFVASVNANRSAAVQKAKIAAVKKYKKHLYKPKKLRKH